MPSMTQFAASGVGYGDVTGNPAQAITSLQWHTSGITNPKVRITGNQYPRRLQFAGSIGLWYPASASSPIPAENVVVWSTPIQFEAEYQDIHLLVKYARYVYWILPMGISVQIQVHW